MVDLDRVAINSLTLRLVDAINQYSAIRPAAPDTYFEILEAIAITVATVCRKAGDDEAIMWFRAAFELQVKDIWQ